MTEVSNPLQRKQKRLGMSSNSFDLKNIATLSEMWGVLPGDNMVSTIRENCVTLKRNTMNFSSSKTCRSLMAECSLPPFLSWSEAPKILRVDLTTKFHFQSQWPITRKKGNSWKCLLCLFSLFPLYYRVRVCIQLLGLFCRVLKHWHDLNEKCLLFTYPEKSIYDEEVWYACLFHPCREQEKTFITTLLCADKVSLFIQSGRDKPWMKHCGTERERDGGKREKTRKRLGFQLLVCVHVSRWHLLEPALLSQETRGWPPALTPFQPPPLPPAASFPASTCPLPH